MASRPGPSGGTEKLSTRRTLPGPMPKKAKRGATAAKKKAYYAGRKERRAKK
jgi:hypothetical protein